MQATIEDFYGNNNKKNCTPKIWDSICFFLFLFFQMKTKKSIKKSVNTIISDIKCQWPFCSPLSEEFKQFQLPYEMQVGHVSIPALEAEYEDEEEDQSQESASRPHRTRARPAKFSNESD